MHRAIQVTTVPPPGTCNTSSVVSCGEANRVPPIHATLLPSLPVDQIRFFGVQPCLTLAVSGLGMRLCTNSMSVVATWTLRLCSSPSPPQYLSLLQQVVAIFHLLGVWQVDPVLHAEVCLKLGCLNEASADLRHSKLGETTLPGNTSLSLSVFVFV